MNRKNPNLIARKSSNSPLLILVSSLACLYVAGRLWEGSRARKDFSRLVQEKSKEEGQTVTSSRMSAADTVKFVDVKEQEKRLALLEAEVASARLKGYLSDDSLVKNSTKRLLAVIGINTGFGEKKRRDSIRSTWMPTGRALKKLEEEHGVIMRFTIGRSANKGDLSDRSINREDENTKDFLILDDHVEAYDELPKKTKNFFATSIRLWDADFYMKIDDDVFVSLDRLIELLKRHRDKPKLYLGCMKSGEIYTETNQRWHEPEWWKFGDAKQYFRHATGQIYALSKALAVYVAVNRHQLHEYRNEDVSLGSWMIGLDVTYVDERLLCCGSPPEGNCVEAKTKGRGCVAVFDWQCSGLCKPVERMAAIQKECGP